MGQALQTAVNRQRLLLSSRLSGLLSKLSEECRSVWPDRTALEKLLVKEYEIQPYCKYLYILDDKARQISSNVSRKGLRPKNFGRDRSERPYMKDAIAGAVFSLSNAYISRNKRRPSLTAIQRIQDENGVLLGYIGVDFDLRELPLTREVYKEPEQWKQIKGDPAIRGGLFAQQRIESAMDKRIDEVLDMLVELIQGYGVFHAKLHLSSSRATLWQMDDPYRYKILDIDDLTDPGICMAWGTYDYPKDASIPMDRVRDVFNTLRQLRFMDETIYLRAGSLNIFNGMVGLNFSCDGSHYIPWAEFLDKKLDFWLGTNNLESDE